MNRKKYRRCMMRAVRGKYVAALAPKSASRRHLALSIVDSPTFEMSTTYGVAVLLFIVIYFFTTHTPSTRAYLVLFCFSGGRVGWKICAPIGRALSTATTRRRNLRTPRRGAAPGARCTGARRGRPSGTWWWEAPAALLWAGSAASR